MENVGYAALQIIPSFKGMDGYLERGTSGPMSKAGTAGGVAFGDSAGKSAGRRFGSVFTAAAKASLFGVIGASALAVKVGADSIEAASDLNESLNAVTVTYGEQAEAVKALGAQAAESIGLSNSEFNGLAVQFSAFATEVAGGAGPKVTGVLDDLTTRAADFASVMNLEVADAASLFQSGLAGETEPLRKYGIDLSAAAVEAHALAEGIANGKDKLTESEKVQARYSLLMEQTAKTQGDFANTSESLANQQRILNARWDDAKARLGTALLPVMEDLVGLVLNKGIPAFEDFSDWFSDEGMDGIKKFGEFTRDEVLPVVKDLGGFLKDAAVFGGDVVKFINDLPDTAKLTALTSTLGAVGFMKLRGGGSGVLGATGSALGMAKPIPVFVTNPGFGGKGGTGGGVVGADGKTKGGRGGTGALLAATVLGPSILEEFKWGFTSPKSPLTNFVNPTPGPDGGGFTATVPDSMQGFDTSGIGKDLQGIPVMAEEALADTAQAFRDADIPTQLKTQIAMMGVPESMAQARALVKQYDLTPKEKRTLFQLLGYETVMRQASFINRELDWAARPREARITVTRSYAAQGYETRGGLQEGGGTKTTQTGNPRSTQRTIDSDRRFNRWMDDRD